MSQGMMESSDMLEEHTPLFDSLSFALLIPFAICFILIFLVCCFADQIKDICRMPSPLPASYLTAEHSRPRHHSRRSRQRSRRQSEEVRNLILSEEGRSRNVSESSSTDLIVSSSNGQTDRQIPSTITNNMATISEMPDNIQTHNSLPSTSDSNKDNLRFVTINPAPHSVVRSNSKNGEKVNFLRNLSLNSSALTLPSLPENSVNSNSSQGKSANTPVSKKSSGSVTPVDSSTSGPRALNDYLTSVLPTTDLTTITCENEVSKKETQSTVDDSQT